MYVCIHINIHVKEIGGEEVSCGMRFKVALNVMI